MEANSLSKSKLVQSLESRWRDSSPLEVANANAAPLFGTPGEWDLPRDVIPKRKLLYLAVGIPDAESLPKEALASAAESVISKPGDLALRYGFGQGPEGIRQWLAERRTAQEGLSVDADWFQLTNGSSGAIDLVVRSLIDPGDVIIAESPTYMGTLHNFKGVGADVRCVPMLDANPNGVARVSADEQGMDMDALAAMLAEVAREGKRVKLIYTISAFQNPSGSTLSTSARERLLALACQYGAIVLDDEAYRELWFDTPPPRAISGIAEGWGVITVGSFSKTVATGIRVGYIHARPELLALFSRMRFAMGQNQVGLRTFGEFLNQGNYDPHLEKVRGIYKAKRDLLHKAMLDAGLDQFLNWSPPEGGFYIWAQLKQELRQELKQELKQELPLEALWRTAVSEGIAVNNGQGFTPLGVSNHIRIAYPWTPVEDFPEAARRLYAACCRVAEGNAA